MGKTIIQSIGPLYGEVVNGTVFGRPNGSIYVPSANTISASIPDAFKFIRTNSVGDAYFICNSAGVSPSNSANFLKVVAESQDIANYMVVQISDSADFDTLIDDTIRPAGQFNETIGNIIFYDVGGLPAIVADQTYYVRCVLMSSTAEPVAVSDTIEFVGVVLS